MKNMVFTDADKNLGARSHPGANIWYRDKGDECPWIYSTNFLEKFGDIETISKRN
jgi:hypothetical protein